MISRNFDKAVTRAACQGASSIILYGRRWALHPGKWLVNHQRKIVHCVDSGFRL